MLAVNVLCLSIGQPFLDFFAVASLKAGGRGQGSGWRQEEVSCPLGATNTTYSGNVLCALVYIGQPFFFLLAGGAVASLEAGDWLRKWLPPWSYKDKVPCTCIW